MPPKLSAARPPAAPPAPVVTFDTENEFWIEPSRLKPTSPPTNEPSSPVTAPLACDPVIDPSLRPTNPPIANEEPLTAPLADELTIEPPVSFRPTRPPSSKAFGTLSATVDCDPVIVPGLSPTSPPTVLNEPPP